VFVIGPSQTLVGDDSMKFASALVLMGSAIMVGLLHAQPADKADSPRETPPMPKESAWTWGYFFSTKDKDAIKTLAGERKASLTLYRVDKVAAIKGKTGVAMEPGAALIRMEEGHGPSTTALANGMF
jgi:hypothetical protein